MNIWPLIRFRLRDSLRGGAVFFVIFMLAMACITVTNVSIDSKSVVSFSGYEISACITVFVFGICTVREDLRLGIQNGVSRRTVFFATLLSSALSALILAAAGDLLTMAAQALTKGIGNTEMSSLYQLLFAENITWLTAPLSMHLGSIFFTFVMLISANLFGSFISLLFFRLNKMWTIIVAVGVPIILSWILPLVLSSLGITLLPLINKILSSPSTISCFFALCTIAAAALNRLLTLRVPIKAAVK